MSYGSFRNFYLEGGDLCRESIPRLAFVWVLTPLLSSMTHATHLIPRTSCVLLCEMGIIPSALSDLMVLPDLTPGSDKEKGASAV